MKLVRIAAVIALGIGVAAFAGVGRPEAAQSAEQGPRERSVTVSGLGAVKTVPDTAEWSFGVVSEAGSARQALEANAEKARHLIDALKAAGIPTEDLRTERVSLYPQTSSDRRVVRYRASNSVHAIVRSIERAGAIVDAASEAGADQVYGPSLTRSNTEELYNEALVAAYEQARAKAAVLAAKAGVSLGEAVSITESSLPPQPFYAGSAMAESSAAPPIEPGQQAIQATVLVTFAIS